MQRLPPLSALRAFEATSRLLSAKKAAEELFVTPAAISHQIKALEDFLGLKLFKRMNRQLLLTDDGIYYATSLQKIFNDIANVTQEIIKNKHSHITISVETEFAMYWLIPRLNKFKETHPAIELRVLASYELTDFKKSDVDMAIRHGFGNYANLHTELLFRNEFYAVCHPSLLKKHPVIVPNDLKNHTLLQRKLLVKSGFPTWNSWLTTLGANEVDSNCGLFLENGFVLMQAALNGQGVAIERKEFLESAIKEGKLKRLFPDFSITPEDIAYYLVTPTDRVQDPKIQAFTSWIKEEIKNAPPAN